MIVLGQRVEIVFSEALRDGGLEGLCSCTGTVVEDLSGPERRNRGYIVLFGEEFEGELSWFVPIDSVVDVSSCAWNEE